jgi:hypothetical protein
MKRILLCLVSTSLFAMPALDPARASLPAKPLFWNPCECWAIKLGYRSDAVFNRHLHNRRQNIDRFSFFAREAVVTLNLLRLVDVFGFVGASKVSFSSLYPLNGGVGTNQFVQAQFNAQTVAGFGAVAVVWEKDFGYFGTGTLSLMAQYEDTSRAHTTSILLNKASVPNRVGIRYREGQVSLGWAQRFGCLYPYMALNWAKAGAWIDGDHTVSGVWLGNEFRARRNLGYAFGATFASGAVTASLEVRCKIENAGTVMVDFAF